MPAASCRIIPACSISRCETISASFGFSFRMGRKNRDNRMRELWRFGETGDAVKPDCPAKHKAGTSQNARKQAGFATAARPGPSYFKLLDDDRRLDFDPIAVGDGNAKREHPAARGRH